jgi:NADH dehydrogenase
MAGAIAELAHRTMVRDFRRIDPTQAKILLIEAGDKVLPTFPEKLSASAAWQLERLGVTVMTRSAVTECGPQGLMLKDGGRIDTATIIWAAGVMASPAAKWFGAATDRAGRVIVEATLKLPGNESIFVIGDTASVTDGNGIAVPGIAPAAKQMGKYAASSILAHLRGEKPREFKYRNYGNLATIGRRAAVADFGSFTLTGFTAWLVWGLAHIWLLIGFRNRLFVFLDWIVAYVSFERGARLITGSEN